MSDIEIPRIGPQISEGEKLYHQFMDSFQDAVEECVKSGRESHMMIAMGKRVILVNVQEAGKPGEAMNEMLKKVATGQFTVKDKAGNPIGSGVTVKPTELEPT